MIANYAYDPYGVPTASSGTDPIASRNPLRYRGYYYDTETGLYYLPARYYEPRSARFLSVDPAAPEAGDPASLNRYSYCFGDPVNAYDPTGAIADYDGDGKQTGVDYDAQKYVNNPTTATRQAARTSYNGRVASGAYKTPAQRLLEQGRNAFLGINMSDAAAVRRTDTFLMWGSLALGVAAIVATGGAAAPAVVGAYLAVTAVDVAMSYEQEERGMISSSERDLEVGLAFVGVVSSGVAGAAPKVARAYKLSKPLAQSVQSGAELADMTAQFGSEIMAVGSVQANRGQ